MSGPIHQQSDGVLIDVYIQPRASRSEVVGIHDGALRLRVAAPPVDGAANLAVIELLSRVTRVRKSDITIISGHASRRKRVLLRGANAGAITAALGTMNAD